MSINVVTNIKTKYNSLPEGRKSVIVAGILCLPVFYIYFYALNTVQDKVTYILSDTLITVLVFFIAALSLDLEVGSLGLPNFGKVAFIAIGAYVTTIIMNVRYFNNFFLDFLLGLAFGLVISAFFGWLIAIPSVKLRADYFAIMTIAAGEIVRLVFQNEKLYFWTFSGYQNTKAPLMLNQFRQYVSNAKFFGLSMSDTQGVNFGVYSIKWNNSILYTLDLNFGNIFYWQLYVFFFFLSFALICYVFVQIIRKSPYGRALRAIREDDITVTSVGKDVYSYRWQVTVIAAIICSIAGSLFCILNSSFEPQDFRPDTTFLLFVFIIIGGVGNSKGVAFGTLLIEMFTVGTSSEAVRSQLNITAVQLLPAIKIPFSNLIIDLPGILSDLQLKLYLSADYTRYAILGIILLIFLLYRPEGIIPEPKSNNENYLSLLTNEERADSDEAVIRMQSSSEQVRLEAESEDNEMEDT